MSTSSNPLHNDTSIWGEDWNQFAEALGKLYWRFSLYILRRSEVVVRIGSLLLLVDVRRTFGRALAIRGFREVDQARIFRIVLRRNDICLEVGANIGFYVVLIQHVLDRSCSILAYEPDRRSREVLRRNISLNGLDHNVIIEKSAISSASGTRALYCAKRWNLSALDMSSLSDRQMEGTCEVPVVDIAQVLSGPQPPTVMRMDVEGHEAIVLKRMAVVGESAMVRLPRVIIFEPHSWEYKDQDGFENTLGRLCVLGYRFTYLGVWAKRSSLLLASGYLPAQIINEAGREKHIYVDIDSKLASWLTARHKGVTTVCMELAPDLNQASSVGGARANDSVSSR